MGSPIIFMCCYLDFMVFLGEYFQVFFTQFCKAYIKLPCLSSYTAYFSLSLLPLEHKFQR